jgi:hypothetical protein
MLPPSLKYEEAMNDSELSFLKEKRAREQRMFIRTIRTLCFVFIIIPCCAGIILESIRRSNIKPEELLQEERRDPYLYLYYFIGMLFLLLLVAVGSYISYVKTLRKIVLDIRSGMKTVEKTAITRKQFMEHNNTYHFYLKSAFRLSIEVNQEDYQAYNEGDEINIEYSTQSGIYFGYF